MPNNFETALRQQAIKHYVIPKRRDKLLTVKQLYKHEPFLFMGKLIMPDGKGNIKSTHDPMKVAVDFFTHDNDTLFYMYGFNWVPEEPYYTRARKLLGY